MKITKLNFMCLKSAARRTCLALISVTLLVFAGSCVNEQKPKAPSDVVIVNKPEEREVRINEQLKELIRFVTQNNNKLNDTVRINYPGLLEEFYTAEVFQPAWSNGKQWLPEGDTLFNLISRAKEYGLFPSDYHLSPILHARNQFVIDSMAQKNVALWARTDVLLSDAFFLMARHLKLGHLNPDSTTLRTDTVFSGQEMIALLQSALSTAQIRTTLESLEPVNPDYQSLRRALPAFLDSVRFTRFTYVDFPYKDSLTFIRQVATRLQEAEILSKDWNPSDSTGFRMAVKRFQESRGIRTTGTAAAQTVRSLNNTNWEKFKRIVINLDRYKQLPAPMPETYVWVNLPAYDLKIIDADTQVFRSKVIVGSPKTRTPVLTSEIVNAITYPQWTVPYSIIFKEMLPKIQKDITYLNKQNLMVVDKNDSVIDPLTINWTALNKEHFPYLLRQRQGDDNSLGVMKFNFRNKYAVYLHDTNARGLFSLNSRALSHGCVRVQEWGKLADFLVRNDSIRYHPDTIRAWIGRQEKHVIADFPHIPIFIRYFTCEVKEGKIRFIDDIYNDDNMLSQRYFKSTPLF